jgi:hypothetical protein
VTGHSFFFSGEAAVNYNLLQVSHHPRKDTPSPCSNKYSYFHYIIVVKDSHKRFVQLLCACVQLRHISQREIWCSHSVIRKNRAAFIYLVTLRKSLDLQCGGNMFLRNAGVLTLHGVTPSRYYFRIF